MKVFLYLSFHIITFESSHVEIEIFWSSQHIFEFNLDHMISNNTNCEMQHEYWTMHNLHKKFHETFDSISSKKLSKYDEWTKTQKFPHVTTMIRSFHKLSKHYE